MNEDLVSGIIEELYRWDLKNHPNTDVLPNTDAHRERARRLITLVEDIKNEKKG